MTAQQNTERIQTTHIGGLPQPHALPDMMSTCYNGGAFDQAAFDAALSRTVTECVQRGAECGIDIVTDCGFSSQALYRTEEHPTVVWEKFKALRKGADIVTELLWGRA